MPGISGLLTILQNEFILKLDEPFEHDGSEAQDGSFILTTSELHVPYADAEQRKALRALVGKYVKFAYAGVRPKATNFDARDLVLEFSEEFFEVYPPGHEFEGGRVETEAERAERGVEASPSPSPSPLPSPAPEARALPPFAFPKP